MKYIEIGVGNTWIIRTETENEDGTEIEQKGIVKPIIYHSTYLRIWLGKSVFILDSKDGFKKITKNRNGFKLIFGIASHLTK